MLVESKERDKLIENDINTAAEELLEDDSPLSKLQFQPNQTSSSKIDIKFVINYKNVFFLTSKPAEWIHLKFHLQGPWKALEVKLICVP